MTSIAHTCEINARRRIHDRCPTPGIRPSPTAGRPDDLHDPGRGTDREPRRLAGRRRIDDVDRAEHGQLLTLRIEDWTSVYQD
jgi:hypothetical protein